MNNTISHTATIKPTTAIGTTILPTTATLFKKAKNVKKFSNVTNKAEFSEKITNKDFQQTILPKDAKVNEISECAEGLADLCEKEQLEWWAYIILAVFVFLVLLLLNFIVKKINDARMEERCRRLYRKSSTCTQVQTKLIKGDFYTKNQIDISKSTTSALTGVSLIFTKSDNVRFPTSTSTSTALRIKDCGETFRNARSFFDNIYEESECAQIIHRDTNTFDIVQNNDNVKVDNDIKETKLASGDANAKNVPVEISTAEKETCDTTVDSNGTIKSKAYFEFEAIRKRFEVLGKRKPIFLKKQFKTSTAALNNDKDMVFKTLCLKGSNEGVVIKSEVDSVEKSVEVKNEYPEKSSREEIKVKHIENKIILNGSKPKGSETEVNDIKDVKSEVSLTEARKNVEIIKEGNIFEKNENINCENT